MSSRGMLAKDVEGSERTTAAGVATAVACTADVLLTGEAGLPLGRSTRPEVEAAEELLTGGLGTDDEALAEGPGLLSCAYDTVTRCLDCACHPANCAAGGKRCACITHYAMGVFMANRTR